MTTPIHASAIARVNLTITLSEELARWLKALMQNPLFEDETNEERINREEIFRALNRVDDRAIKQSAFTGMDDDIPF